MDLKPYLISLRTQIEFDLKNDQYGLHDITLGYIDEYLHESKRSDLEKAFYLLLNRFPGDHADYLVRESEHVLIPDVYDLSAPGIEYEIDFAIYGGSLRDPLKVAIEVDGQRSHGQKHARKDRRKDVNLQAAGWLVMRFTSREIHEELLKYADDHDHIPDFLYSIENVIREKLQLVTGNAYARTDVRSVLTGYDWGVVTCPHCEEVQQDILNKKKLHCRHCGQPFTRALTPHEHVKFEYNGLWYFEKGR